MTTGTVWRYTAENSDQGLVKGRLDARDLEDARHKLSANGLNVLSIAPLSDKGGRALFGSGRSSGSGRLTSKDVASVSGVLSKLLLSGLPLATALQIGKQQARRKTDIAIFDHLEGVVRTGVPLSTAIKDSPKSFPKLAEAMILTGEELGQLGDALERLSSHFGAAAKRQQEFIGQMLYPFALLFMIFGTLLFLSFVVMPQFESVFDGALAPPETEFVIGAAQYVRDYIGWMILFLVGSIAAFAILVRRYPSTRDRFALGLPAIGSWIMLNESAQYCRGLGALVSGGAPLAKAMPIARRAVGNTILSERLEKAEDAIADGASLSAGLTEAGALVNDAISYIEIGEKMGELGKLVSQAADTLESRITNTIRIFATIASPVMTAMLGLITAGVVMAVMSGVLSLNETVYQ